MTLKATDCEILAFIGGIIVVVIGLDVGDRQREKQSFALPYCSVVHNDSEFIENKFVVLTESVANRW
jgi:hypothetical protein